MLRLLVARRGNGQRVRAERRTLRRRGGRGAAHCCLRAVWGGTVAGGGRRRARAPIYTSTIRVDCNDPAVGGDVIRVRLIPGRRAANPRRLRRRLRRLCMRLAVD